MGVTEFQMNLVPHPRTNTMQCNDAPSIDSLNGYIGVFRTTDTLRTSQLFEDFAAIYHKDSFGVKWFKDTPCHRVSKQDCLHGAQSVRAANSLYLEVVTHRVSAVRQLVALAPEQDGPSSLRGLLVQRHDDRSRTACILARASKASEPRGGVYRG